MPKKHSPAVEDIKSPNCHVKVEYPQSKFRALQGFNKRIEARYMFIKEGFSIEEIATLLRETPEQITQWGLEENWERKRLAIMTSTDQSADILERKLTEYLIDLENDKTFLSEHAVRVIEKASKAIAALRADKATLSGIMNTMQLFIDYLKVTDPSLLSKIEPHIEGFIEKRRKQAGV